MVETGGPNKPLTFPHEVLKYILLLLGPLELDACGGVCRDWRKEVNRRVTALKIYTVTTLEKLQEILSILKDPKSICEIKTLDLFNEGPEPYPVLDMIDLLSNIPWISLGRLRIRGKFTKAQEGQLIKVLHRFHNLVSLEFENSDLKFTQFHCLDEVTEDVPFFPVLRNLRITNYEACLNSILSACPNLRWLVVWKLRGPYSNEGIDGSKLKHLTIGFPDIPSLNQLRTLNLSLRILNVQIGFDSTNGRNPPFVGHMDERQNQILIRALGQFLQTQASSLEILILCLNINIQCCLFPVALPNLWRLDVNLEFASDMNHILNSVPELNRLTLDPLKKELKRDRSISPFIPHGLNKKHSDLDHLEIGYKINPVELSLFGYTFKNLTSLFLIEVYHGIPRTVWSQFTRLTKLVIVEMHEENAETLLRDSDFILTASDSDPDGPYIGNMRNLKELELEFTPNSSLITELILIHGVCHIVAQLDQLIISGFQLPEDIQDQLSLQMSARYIPDPEETSHKFIKNK